MKLATLDLETDPFEYGKIPRPFASGLYDGEKTVTYWGPDCVTRMIAYLATLDEGMLIYAHNGGKFDFYYFLPAFSGAIRIINNRIVSALIGQHEVRDSFAIMPFPLRAYKKTEMDYQKLRAEVREKHREEILAYLRDDCKDLFDLVTAFHAEFGSGLTIGGSALKQLRKRHPFKCGGRGHDEKFREHFYFGGRVQVFKGGIVNQPVEIYDVNSMYPNVMKSCLHPIGTQAILDKRVRANTCFVVAEGTNYGAFCRRAENGSLDFPGGFGRYSTTIHEWQAAEETGTFRTSKVIKTYGFDDRVTFDEFVSHFYGVRQQAIQRGDKILDLLYKYCLNSAYGKFAQNPENFSEYQITDRETLPENACDGQWLRGRLKPCPGTKDRPCTKFHMAYLHPEYIIWRKPTERKTYYNIVTGASITGAARAVLLRGLAHATDPIYCDTDSIIARSMHGVAMGSSVLGEWKLEGMGNTCAIAGKKLYAVFDTREVCTCKTATKKDPCRHHIKKAHKGAILSYDQIWRIAEGEEIETFNQVPAFKMDGEHQFVSRKMRRTV